MLHGQPWSLAPGKDKRTPGKGRGGREGEGREGEWGVNYIANIRRYCVAKILLPESPNVLLSIPGVLLQLCLDRATPHTGTCSGESKTPISAYTDMHARSHTPHRGLLAVLPQSPSIVTMQTLYLQSAHREVKCVALAPFWPVFAGVHVMLACV